MHPNQILRGLGLETLICGPQITLALRLVLLHRAHRWLEFLGLTPLVMDLPAWKNYTCGRNIYWCINSYITTCCQQTRYSYPIKAEGWGRRRPPQHRRIFCLESGQAKPYRYTVLWSRSRPFWPEPWNKGRLRLQLYSSSSSYDPMLKEKI